MSNRMTGLRLLAVPLENDYLHTLHFNSKESQASYFISKTVKADEDYAYQRKDKVIRYPAEMDTIIHCNYVMYRNENFSSKWYYAFITKMEYVNDNMTYIHIETDVIQTWLFDYTLKPSFVEREHVENDTIGLHTVPEQLETGDYVINKKNKNASLLANTLIMAVTVDLNDYDDALIGSGKYAPAGGDFYNGIYSGLKFYKVTKNEANRAIKALAGTGQSDAIVAIFTCPSLFVNATYPEGNENGYAEVDSTMNATRKDWVNTLGVEDSENYKPTDIDGYVPKNNKLFTYPYCYMLMSNNSGGTAVYKYELFNNPENNNHCAFYIYASITPSFSITISPRYYNNVDINSLERLNLGKFPVCAWASDVYTNWLTQNGINIPLSIGSALVSAGIGVGGALLAPATGGLSAVAALGAGSALAGGVTGIAGTLAEKYKHSLQPPQIEGNVNSGDVTFSSGTLTFTAYQMTIKREYAYIIDSYFNMFGYQVNEVKVPLSNHRENYWYTKCNGVNIDAHIPLEDLQKIKDCYNRGITFWKNPSNIKNYNVSNSITIGG